MDKLWPHSRIFLRILLVAVSAVILSTFLCSVAIYLYITPVIRGYTVSSHEEMLVKMLDQVSNDLSEVTAYATNIAFDDTIQEVLVSGQNSKGYPYYSEIQRMERKLNEYVILRDNLIHGIYVADAQQGVLEVNEQYATAYGSSVYDKLRQKDETGFTRQHHMIYNSGGASWDTVGYVSDVYDRALPSVHLGKLVILLDIDAITDSLHFGEESGICVELYNSQTGRIYSSDQDRNLEQELQEQISSSSDYIFRHDLGVNGWYALCAVSDRQVNEPLHKLNMIIVGIIVSILILMLSVISRITINIVRPLDTLVQGMRQVSKGSRSERIVVNTHDEIKDAAGVFNQMVEAIDKHTHELLESEKKAHESYLQMLIYQINPHFIYNTLNCVICLARKEDHQSIIRLTRVLITFLRTILRVDSRSMTTLREEMTYMDCYVQILQYSYHNVGNLIWEVDEELMDITLPKLILYPLVENSIFHGIIPAEHQGSVTIRIWKHADEVVVSVTDTGRGFQEEVLEHVRDSLVQGAELPNHIGIHNVNSRLKLIYGNDSGLRIQSEFGKGTEITFRFLR